jgi:hypothetical protein
LGKNAHTGEVVVEKSLFIEIQWGLKAMGGAGGRVWGTKLVTIDYFRNKN